MENTQNKYYNWQKTLSYDAKISMIITMRGYGKTYGIRKQVVKDYLKNGSHFAVITRFKSNLEGEDSIQTGFFDKLQLNNEFPNYLLKTRGKRAYIAVKPENDDIKPKWKMFGYFVALTQMQKSKEKTFVNVKRIIFDEFIIDKRTRSQYLTGEFNLFINAIDSLVREENDKPTQARIYLLGNSCDLTNPYFARFNIYKEPQEGYSWHNNRSVLVHYAKDSVFQEGKRNTLVGTMVAGTQEEQIIIDNIFANSNSDYIAKKPKNAKFYYGLVFQGNKFGVWYDEIEAIIYISSKIPKNTPNIYSLTTSDNRINYLIAKKTDRLLKSLVDMYYNGILRYENNYIYDQFMRILYLFGVK